MCVHRTTLPPHLWMWQQLIHSTKKLHVHAGADLHRSLSAHDAPGMSRYLHKRNNIIYNDC